MKQREKATAYPGLLTEHGIGVDIDVGGVNIPHAAGYKPSQLYTRRAGAGDAVSPEGRLIDSNRGLN